MSSRETAAAGQRPQSRANHSMPSSRQRSHLRVLVVFGRLRECHQALRSELGLLALAVGPEDVLEGLCSQQVAAKLQNKAREGGDKISSGKGMVRDLWSVKTRGTGKAIQGEGKQGGPCMLSSGSQRQGHPSITKDAFDTGIRTGIGRHSHTTCMHECAQAQYRY